MADEEAALMTLGRHFIHVVIPEGLNQVDRPGQPLSDYSEACLRRVAETATHGEMVYFAPGNVFGHALAAGVLRQLRSDLITHIVGGTREGYVDTLDNAVLLREWARRHNRWPMANCWLYGNCYHLVRTWLYFRIAGYRVRRIVACAQQKWSGLIVARLKYYDYPITDLVYEALGIAHTFLRLAKNVVRTGSLLPSQEKTS